MYEAEYRAKLRTPDEAIKLVPARGTLSMGMAVSEPPALLRREHRALGLVFLAPEIVESIVEGRQPTTLTAEALTRRIALPLSWSAQRTALNV